MKEKIIEILNTIRPEFDFGIEQTGFVENRMLDSFDVVHLVGELETAFGVVINGADITPETFDSIEEIEKLLQKKHIEMPNNRNIEILILHRVLPNKSVLRANNVLELTPNELEKIIVYYQNNDYQFISIDDVEFILRTKKYLNQKYVCFTLDDGYADNYEYAYPLFKKYNIPFCIYVTTGFPDHTTQVWWYALEEIIMNNDCIKLGNNTKYTCKSIEEKNETFKAIRETIFRIQTTDNRKILDDLFCHYSFLFDEFVKNNALSWKHIKLLSQDSLCTIGAHSIHHLNLTNIDEQTLTNELLLSKQILEKHIQKEIYHLSYPFGETNDNMVEKTKTLGYKTAVMALGGKEGEGFDLYKLKRKNSNELLYVLKE